MRARDQFTTVFLTVVLASVAPMAAALAEDSEPRAAQSRGDLAASEQAVISLFERLSPSVAYITSVALERDWYSLNIYEIPRGAGSGFVWDRQGHIVTAQAVARVETEGALVMRVGRGSGAERAGIRGTRRGDSRL